MTPRLATAGSSLVGDWTDEICRGRECAALDSRPKGELASSVGVSELDNTVIRGLFVSEPYTKENL